VGLSRTYHYRCTGPLAFKERLNHTEVSAKQLEPLVKLFELVVSPSITLVSPHELEGRFLFPVCFVDKDSRFTASLRVGDFLLSRDALGRLNDCFAIHDGKERSHGFLLFLDWLFFHLSFDALVLYFHLWFGAGKAFFEKLLLHLLSPFELLLCLGLSLALPSLSRFKLILGRNTALGVRNYFSDSQALPPLSRQSLL
jgi:hypothetical protein